MGTRYNRVIYPGRRRRCSAPVSAGSSARSSARSVGGWSGSATLLQDAAAASRLRAISSTLRTAFADDVREPSRRLGRDLGGWLH